MNHPNRTAVSPSTAPPDSETQRWLLAHDIADPKRLQKVWRLMRKEGLPLQYSLYLVQGNRQCLQRLLEQIAPLIDSKRDDLRVYPLGENTRLWGLGTQFNEGGNTLTDDIIERLRRHIPDTTTASQTATKPLRFAITSNVGIPSRKPAPDLDISD